MSASVRPVVPERILTRPGYEGLFGLLLVALILLSTLDEAAPATVGRGLLLGCFAVLTLLNTGAALGVYIAAALVFSVHHFGGRASWAERPDNFALVFLMFYLVAGRCFSRSAGTFGPTALAVALLLVTTSVHLFALVGMDGYWFSWFGRMFAVPLGLFVLLRRAALSRRELRALCLIVAVLAVYLAAVTLMEVLGWYALIIPPWMSDPEFNPGVGSARIGGLAMQPEFNALDISLAFCMILLLRIDRRQSRVHVGWLAGSGLCVLALYFTYTRAAYLGLLLGGVPLFWQRSAAAGVTLRRRAIFLAGALGFAVFVLFFPSEILQDRVADAGTVTFRFAIWAAGLGMVLAHPLFGVGFGQFPWHLSSFLGQVTWTPFSEAVTLAHNTFLSVAAELGLIGLTLYVLVIWGVFRSAWEAAGTAWGQAGRTWVAGFTIVYFVNAQFITAHELIPNVLYFGVLGAIAGMRVSGERPSRPQPARRA